MYIDYIFIWGFKSVHVYSYNVIIYNNIIRDNDPSGFMFITQKPNCYNLRTLKLSTSYIQNFVVRHFSMCNCSLCLSACTGGNRLT